MHAVRTPRTTGKSGFRARLHHGAAQGCRARKPPETIGRQQPHKAACAAIRALASRGRCSAPERGGDGRGLRSRGPRARGARGVRSGAREVPVWPIDAWASGSALGRSECGRIESRARPSGVKGAGQTGPDASVDAHGASGTRPTRLRAAAPATHRVHRRDRGPSGTDVGRRIDRRSPIRSQPEHSHQVAAQRADAYGLKFRAENSVVATQVGRAEEAIQRSSRRTNRGRSS